MLSTETARTIPPNPRREGHTARGIAGLICQCVRPTSGAGIEVFYVLLKKRLIAFLPLSPFMFLTCMKECSRLSPILSTEPTGTIPANLHHSELREPVGHSFAQSFPQSRAHACKVWYERSCELDKRSSFESCLGEDEQTNQHSQETSISNTLDSALPSWYPKCTLSYLKNTSSRNIANNIRAGAKYREMQGGFALISPRGKSIRFRPDFRV